METVIVRNLGGNIHNPLCGAAAPQRLRKFLVSLFGKR